MESVSSVNTSGICHTDLFHSFALLECASSVLPPSTATCERRLDRFSNVAFSSCREVDSDPLAFMSDCRPPVSPALTATLPSASCFVLRVSLIGLAVNFLDKAATNCATNDHARAVLGQKLRPGDDTGARRLWNGCTRIRGKQRVQALLELVRELGRMLTVSLLLQLVRRA